MAANTATSSTATVVAVSTDTVFSATYKLGPRDEANDVYCYIKYTKGANNLSLTFDTINASLHATDKYRITFITADDDVGVLTPALSATGNYRLAIPVAPGETQLIANLTFAGTGGTDIAVINFMEA